VVLKNLDLLLAEMTGLRGTRGDAGR
jgi:hypothetical protein